MGYSVVERIAKEVARGVSWEEALRLGYGCALFERGFEVSAGIETE